MFQIHFMSTKLLFPHAYKRVGWVILVPSTIAGLLLTYYGFEAKILKATVPAFFYDELLGTQYFFKLVRTDITVTCIGLLFIVGSILVGFSKEKREDEYIANLRLTSLLWAVYVNYGLLFIAFLFIYGTNFFNVMVYNMFTTLIIFIMRFNYLLYRNTQSSADEK